VEWSTKHGELTALGMFVECSHAQVRLAVEWFVPSPTGPGFS